MGFKGESINRAHKDEAPKAPKDEAPRAPRSTPSRTSQKKDAPPCYYGDIHWFRDCPYINKLVRLKDWKSDKATATKVKERIASASD